MLNPSTVGPEASAMAKATSIPEIIVMFLAVADEHTLVAALRTCRAWYPIAVEQLWEVLDSFEPLVQLVGEQVSLRLPVQAWTCSAEMHF